MPTCYCDVWCDRFLKLFYSTSNKLSGCILARLFDVGNRINYYFVWAISHFIKSLHLLINTLMNCLFFDPDLIPANILYSYFNTDLTSINVI